MSSRQKSSCVSRNRTDDEENLCKTSDSSGNGFDINNKNKLHKQIFHEII